MVVNKLPVSEISRRRSGGELR